MIESGIPSDELEPIANAIYEQGKMLSESVEDAIAYAIRSEIDDVHSKVSDFDSESALDDYIETIRRLAKRVQISDRDVQNAVTTIKDRIGEIGENTPEPTPPSIKDISAETDRFDDAGLRDLFGSLVSS